MEYLGILQVPTYSFFNLNLYPSPLINKKIYCILVIIFLTEFEGTVENDSVSSTTTQKNNFLEGDELLAQSLGKYLYLGRYIFSKLKFIFIPFLNS